MSSSVKPSSRYTSFDSRSSSNSNPSSSSDLKSNNHSSLRRFISGGGTSNGGGGGGGSAVRRNSPDGVLMKPYSSDLVKANGVKKEQNLSAMVKKFMEKKSFSSTSSSKVNRKGNAGINGAGTGLVVAADLLAGELKKPVKKASGFTALQRKLFNKGSSDSSKSEVKALTEVKSNTRTLAMVLRSERELLSLNKELEAEMLEIRLLLEEKNTEVEKLKDLCLMQREEIKKLKSTILFPDVANSQLQDLFEKQGTELRQAKQVIPTLQRQVTSLTGQLQCLAEDLAEVKADKFSSQMGFEGHISSPMTPTYDQEVGNSLEFSSGDYTTPQSSDEMFMKDLNPLLTPYAKTRSKEFQTMLNDDCPPDERLSNNHGQIHHIVNFDPNVRKLSRSSDYCHKKSNPGRVATRVASRRSDESKCTFGKKMHHQQF